MNESPQNMEKEAMEMWSNELLIELEAHTRLNGNEPTDADGMMIVQEWLVGVLKAAYSLGEKAMLEKVLAALPPERIIHEYMESQNTPENRAWNEYRDKAMKALQALTSN